MCTGVRRYRQWEALLLAKSKISQYAMMYVLSGQAIIQTYGNHIHKTQLVASYGLWTLGKQKTSRQKLVEESKMAYLNPTGKFLKSFIAPQNGSTQQNIRR